MSSSHTTITADISVDGILKLAKKLYQGRRRVILRRRQTPVASSLNQPITVCRQTIFGMQHYACSVAKMVTMCQRCRSTSPTISLTYRVNTTCHWSPPSLRLRRCLQCMVTQCCLVTMRGPQIRLIEPKSAKSGSNRTTASSLTVFFTVFANFKVFSLHLPYILAYKSLSRISHPLKIRSWFCRNSYNNTQLDTALKWKAQSVETDDCSGECSMFTGWVSSFLTAHQHN